MVNFKRVCVFCGSNFGYRKIFSDAALDLGHELVKRKMDLIYGGGSIGLMGLVSQTVYDGGCNVLGVIPTALISGQAVGDVLVVSDMHERKAEMARRSDAFIALPGGYGTMEELLEMITWSQLGIHNKPVGLLNIDGYYDCLLGLFDKGVEDGFIRHSARNIVISANTAGELIEKMEVTRFTSDYLDYHNRLYTVEWTPLGSHQDYAPLHSQVAPSRSWNTEEPELANL
ncbi:hypothetical protein BUALT_Bualt02G0013800 [Buddleja alternifolia]|uniref:Cytokinin riboside 5'-monophosphate phosphoribohydrolase n=1 Tax=Buddleja alternifolia TaxID=168488 RepID=A0AAV6Y0U0_9LAMI|nr:hypothetical protein BUALT_Bualt02G0013800 [Buddleja alternifolia]